MRNPGTGDRHAEAAGGCEQKPRRLQAERDLVNGALTDERDVRPEQDDVQCPARVAEVTVGDELQRIHRRHSPERVARQQEAPRPRQHPHLAPVLIGALRRRLLVADRLGLVHRAAAPLDRERGEAEVVAEGRLSVVAPPDRVNRAVAAGDRAEP